MLKKYFILKIDLNISINTILIHSLPLPLKHSLTHTLHSPTHIFCTNVIKSNHTQALSQLIDWLTSLPISLSSAKFTINIHYFNYLLKLHKWTT